MTRADLRADSIKVLTDSLSELLSKRFPGNPYQGQISWERDRRDSIATLRENITLLAALSTGDKSSPAPAPCPECDDQGIVSAGDIGGVDPCPTCGGNGYCSAPGFPAKAWPQITCPSCQPAPGGEPSVAARIESDALLRELTAERDALKAENERLRELAAGLEGIVDYFYMVQGLNSEQLAIYRAAQGEVG